MSRSRLVIFLDCVALLLALVALSIELTGGVHTDLGGIRLSARSIDRAVLATAVAVGLRLFVSRRVPAFGIQTASWRRLRDRVYCPTTDRIIYAPTAGLWRRALLATLAICAFGAVLGHRQLADMYAVPDLGDPLFSMWRIGWVYHQMLGDPRPLFNANIFYPEPLTLTYSDSMLLPAFTAAPLLAAGIHAAVAYNLLFLSSFVLSGIAAYLLVERLTHSPRAAFIAALVFGFYPFRFEHYSHFELQMMHWMPLALIALHEFVLTLRVRHAIAAALCVVAQLYSAMYYALFFTLYAAGVIGILMVSVRAPLRRLPLPVGAAAAVVIALSLPLARPYLAATPMKGDRQKYDVMVFSATASDYLRANHRSALYGPRMLPGRRPERALFPGILPIALAAAALVPPIGITRLAYLVGLLVAFDGSLGFRGLIYPYLYDWCLPFRSLRSPARFSVLVGLSLAVLAGFGVRRLFERWNAPRARNVVFGVLIIAAAADAWPILELRAVWREPPPIYGSLADAHDTVLAEFPINDDPQYFADNTPYMYFSLWHWRDMVNGYSGFLPGSYEELAKQLKAFPSAAGIEALKAHGVTHVTVNCALYGRTCQQVLDAMDRFAAFRRIAEGRWQGKPVRLYELAR